jgi:hypothetical protein
MAFVALCVSAIATMICTLLTGASGLNMWHSFNYGSAHFIMIDTETDIGPNSPEGPGTLWNSGMD